MRLVVSGGWSYGNVGDEAIAVSTLYLAKKFFSEYELLVTAYNTNDFLRHHSINALKSIHAIIADEFEQNNISIEYYLHSGNKEITEYISYFDKDTIFLMSGGGYISGTWNDQIFARILEIEVAKMKGAKVFIIGQSIGPIYSKKLSKIFVEAANKCDFLSVRDGQSIEYLKEIGVIKDINLTSDLAMIISDVYPFEGENKNHICVMPACYTKYQPNYVTEKSSLRIFLGKIHNRYNMYKYRRKINKIVANISKQRHIDFVLSTDWDADFNYVQRIIQNTGIKDYSIYRELSILKMCGVLASGELTISSKMHPLIISTSYLIPTIGISYNFKTDHFMDIISRGGCCFRNSKIDTRKCEQIIERDLGKKIERDGIELKKKEIYMLFKALKDSLSNTSL